MSVKEELMDVITTVLILMEAIIVLVWMDMSWIQIITLVQVMFIHMHGCMDNTHACTPCISTVVSTYVHTCTVIQ